MAKRIALEPTSIAANLGKSEISPLELMVEVITQAFHLKSSHFLISPCEFGGCSRPTYFLAEPDQVPDLSEHAKLRRHQF